MPQTPSLLGVGSNSAAVYDRLGTTKVTDFEETTQVSWERALGAISQANVTVPVSGHGPLSVCCGNLGGLGTWGHTLCIFRDGRRVWEGPIIRLTYRRQEVFIEALDVLGYLTRRVAHARQTATRESVVDEADVLLSRAFATDDPNVLGNVTVIAAGAPPRVRRDVKEAQGYYDEDLATLGAAGLRFTTVGRGIWLWPDSETLGRIGTLDVDQHLLADVDVIEDGNELATRSFAVNDTGQVGQFGTSRPFFGLVEHLVQLSRSNIHATGLTEAATADRKQHLPHGAAPLIVQIPDGAQVSPAAPFPIDTLVAGALLPVEAANVCRRVATDMVLSRVAVTEDQSGEKVGISVIPLTGDVA